MSIHRLEELHPRDLDSRLAQTPLLVFAVGTIEWHGHHLPLGLDGLKAQALARGVAQQTGAVLAPTSWWAADGVPFPYTLRLAADPITTLLSDALSQFAHMGFAAICLVNGHYGLANSRVVRAASLRCMEATGATVLPIADYEALTAVGNHGDHAGTWEASLLWAHRPDLIRLDAVAPDEPLEGVIGEDPRGGRASRELGERASALAVAAMSGALQRAPSEDAEVRDRYCAALLAGLDALDHIAELRARLPRDRVPPIPTPAWIAHLEALLDGRYDDARVHANRKCAVPTD
jgi:creatinine amidohydrolase